MENVKICEIRKGSRSSYPHRISNDEKFLFCCSPHTELSIGDKIYCIDKPRKKAFFTVFTGDQLYTRYNFLPDEWSFEYNNEDYAARKNDVFLKFKVLEVKDLPATWDWRTTLGRNQLYDLWYPDIDLPHTRKPRAHDLQMIFTKGPSYELLEQCKKQLEEPVISAEETFEPYVKIYEPAKFTDKYRKILMAIKTKPFVLLAGISGIGKSRLVRTLAYKTCSEEALRNVDKPGNFELIKVKPEWHDSSELVGHIIRQSDHLSFHITTFLRFIVKARLYPQIPFFLCLDEMNLAKVEQYFAEFLSILESRRFDKGRMYSDTFISAEEMQLYSKEDALFWKKLGIEGHDLLCEDLLRYGIMLPPNLIVMGTVNMDETTHTFSRKVLDRAMTIEMNDFDMREGLNKTEGDWEYPEQYMNAGFLNEEQYDVVSIIHKYPSLGTKVIKELSSINDALLDSPFRFAYRTRNEILIYCACNKELLPSKTSQSEWIDICLDEMIMMKVLSRIEGSEKRCGDVIRNLLGKVNSRFPGTHRKLMQMQYQLNNTGYTSFWN